MRKRTIAFESLEARVAPATFTVTTLDDAGVGSLRQALIDADNTPRSDKIKFKLPAPPVNSENIILLASELTSKGNVTITGPGAGKLIIDGNNASRIFNITDTVANTDSPTAISGLSIVHGNAGGGEGGGVQSFESLSLKDVVISGNVSNNGGGVILRGNSTAGTKVNISKSLITGNTSGNWGGGLDLLGLTSISISKSVVTGNTATALQGGGIYAGIHATGTGISISNSTISGNTANQGGGIFIRSSNANSKVKATISNSTISSNTSTAAAANGGGGVSTGPGNIVIKNSTIRDNTAVQNGGGVFATGFTSLNISGGRISGNRTTDTATAFVGGGGLGLVGTGSATPLPATIKGTNITDNTAGRDGGGIFAKNGIALILSNAIVSGNHAGIVGGGIGISGTGVNKVNLTVKGGAITDNQISFNASGAGGGMWLSTDGAVSITSSKITGNTTIGSGGGIYAVNLSSLTLKNVSFANNSATANGGGLAIIGVPNFQVVGGSLKGNSANSGGAISVSGSTGSILKATISGNAAITSGGGVFQTGGGAVTLQVAKVKANSAPSGPDISGVFTLV